MKRAESRSCRNARNFSSCVNDAGCVWTGRSRLLKGEKCWVESNLTELNFHVRSISFVLENVGWS